MALFKTASGSLTRRQILADFLLSIATQQMLPLRPSKVTTGVVFSCLIARLAKLVTNWNILWFHAIPMLSWNSIFKYQAFKTLLTKKASDPCDRPLLNLHPLQCILHFSHPPPNDYSYSWLGIPV